MKKIEFNFDEDFDGTYFYDDDYYVIQNDKVFLHNEDGYIFTDEFTPEQIQFYGEELKTESHVYELKILEIKELENGKALIHADDGCDFNFWFLDEDYKNHKNEYEIGKMQNILLFADILSSELPEDFREGVILEGKDARNFFEWIDETEALEDENSSAVLQRSDVAVYSETNDFEKTGIYNFTATVNNPGYADNPSEEIGGDTFELAVMNQLNKENPRYVTATFVNQPYTFPKFEPNEDDEDELFSDGWALKGTMRFVAGHKPKDKDLEKIDFENVLKYGDNPVTFPEAKGFCNYDEEDYFEDEDGNRFS